MISIKLEQKQKSISPSLSSDFGSNGSVNTGLGNIIDELASSGSGKEGKEKCPCSEKDTSSTKKKNSYTIKTVVYFRKRVRTLNGLLKMLNEKSYISESAGDVLKVGHTDFRILEVREVRERLWKVKEEVELYEKELCRFMKSSTEYHLDIEDIKMNVAYNSTPIW
nr:unnamed protein product [Callosobruchus analis]